MDEKLNAVLAEARKSARRVSGPHRRLEASEGTALEGSAHELAEHRSEEAIAGLRAEIHGEIAGLREEVAGLRDELATTGKAAARAEAAAAQSAERASRLEDALRKALRDLAG